MASLPILDRTGKEVGTYEVGPADLTPRINKQLLHDAVVMYQANLRQGSVRTKSRAAVAGSTKKMYRQKGTGNARAGSRRSNIRRGGGHTFAKTGFHDWTYRLPRKALRSATRMALASRLKDGEVVLIDELKFDEPKTSEMAGILQAVGVAGKSVLVVVADRDMAVYKSIRNITGAQVAPESELNALSLLMPRKVLMTKAAIEQFRSRLTTAVSA